MYILIALGILYYLRPRPAYLMAEVLLDYLL